MNKFLRERLVTHIKKRYDENQNIDKDDKIDLTTLATKIYDPSLYEFKKQIYNSIKTKIDSNDDHKKIDGNYEVEDTLEDLEDLEDLDDLEDSDHSAENIANLEILEKIDQKVLSILHHLNIGIYDKNDLKMAIINDMLNYIFILTTDNGLLEQLLLTIPTNISQEVYISTLKKINSQELKIFLANCYKTNDNEKKQRVLTSYLTKEDLLKLWCIFNSIVKYIENHIDYEFTEYKKRQIQIKNDLWEDLSNRIKGYILEKFEEHKKKRVKKITTGQISNFLRIVLEDIDDNYIKIDKKEKKLNNEDYIYLKNRVKKYIQEKYFENKD